MLNSPTKILRLRGDDPTGHGEYGMPRGKRKHEGTDYLTNVGEEIFAVTSGKIRVGQVYSYSKEMLLVEVKNAKYKAKQMYLVPIVKTGDYVTAGELIGHAQNVSKFHGGKMKNHCHVSIWKNGLLTDPEPIIK